MQKRIIVYKKAIKDQTLLGFPSFNEKSDKRYEL